MIRLFAAAAIAAVTLLTWNIVGGMLLLSGSGGWGWRAALMPLLYGFAYYMAASLMAGLVLAMALPGIRRHSMRLLFVIVVVAFACITTGFSTILGSHDGPYVLRSLAHTGIGWLLAGMVMALLIPKKSTATLSHERDAPVLPSDRSDLP